MKPWRQVAKPHADVLNGTLKQSEFAADLYRVAEGTASDEYQDAVSFFERTYITEGMKELLVSVAERLSGKGGDPVVQLKTNFGGGKTHSMLAVWHLATRTVPTAKLKGVRQVLDAARVDDLPKARCAVIVGNCISPNQPQERGGLQLRTLWGRLAYELLQEDGYELVRPSDEAGTAPGTDVLVKLLKKAAPCVILCDELVAFLRQLVRPKMTLTAGTFESNLSFLQSLTEAMKAVPDAMLLASLPQSEEELGGEGGAEALTAIEAIFTRVQSIWKPVAPEESFEIVRRRLFASIGGESEREDTCRAFMEMYHASPTLFPTDVQEAAYADRMRKTYPLHPEVFDRLYTDWSTLPKFQKTRGVLQYMAIVINRLWNLDNNDALITLGAIPLSDTDVEAKSTQYLIPGWEPVIESEIDGLRSIAGQLDAQKPDYGAFKMAQRTARSIFFGSAPSSVCVQANSTRGIDELHIRLGSALPGMSLGVFEDVLSDLRDKSQYLTAGLDRFWYDTRPNLRREMETRKSRVPQLKLDEKLQAVVKKVVGTSACFPDVHIFRKHGDIEDLIKSNPRLVVMPPEHGVAYSKRDERRAFAAAQEILDKRGNQPRSKANRLIFLFPDINAVNRLIDEGKKCLAWWDIVDSCEQGTLTLDNLQQKNAQSSAKKCDIQLEATARECYSCAVVPVAPDAKSVAFTEERVNTQNGPIAAAIESWVCEEEYLVKAWNPIFLKQLLEKYYFKNGIEEVSLKKVWNDTCSYLYMPRIRNEEVFLRAFTDGIASKDFFGFASAKDGANYIGFKFGEGLLLPCLDDQMLVLSKKRAEELDDARKCPKCGKLPCACKNETQDGVCPVCGQKPCVCGGDDKKPQVCSKCGQSPCQCGGEVGKKHFFGTIQLDPVDPVVKMSDVLENVISLFTAKPGVKVSVKLDIEASAAVAFDKNTVIRPVSENSKNLGFSSSEFTAE